MNDYVGLAVGLLALRALSRKGTTVSKSSNTVPVITYEQTKGRTYEAGPPQVIPMPAGWRRMSGEEVGPEESAFAKAALRTKGTPGNQQLGTMTDGTEVMALTEWHYHQPQGPVRPWGWHHGITLLVRK